MSPLLLNLGYAAMGGIMLIVFSWVAARLFSTIMGFSVRSELQRGNIAVGLAMLGIFLGVGVGLGMVIGMSLN